jgi:hypothetical protein
MQVGITGTNFGVMFNIILNRGVLLSATDPTLLASPGWRDISEGIKPLIGGPQAINAAGNTHNDLTITNSLLVTTSCTGIKTSVIGAGSFIDIENNTLIWPGNPTGGIAICNGTPLLFTHSDGTTTMAEKLTLKNNVAHAYAFGLTSSQVRCPIGAPSVIAGNKLVKYTNGGTLGLAASTYCPDGAAAGSLLISGGPSPSMMEGGVTFTAADPQPSDAFVAYPTLNTNGDGKNLDLHPKPGGPLDATGVPTTLCCNVDGLPRDPTHPNIGAY